MQDELNTTIREAIERLYPSLDDVPPSWKRIVADADPKPARRSRQRSRRFFLRAGLVGAAATAVALGALSVFPSYNFLPESGPSAIARAATALTPPSDKTILHTIVVTTQTRPDGTTTDWHSETWQQTTPPYAARQLGARELAVANGALQYYNPRTNTIHTTPPNSIPASESALGPDEGLRQRMLDLLHSGGAREDGHVTIVGRDAIRIVSSDNRLTLVIDAATSEPIEWSWTSNDGASETSRFQTYEWLAATTNNLALLNLRAQHPSATIRQDATVTGRDSEGE